MYYINKTIIKYLKILFFIIAFIFIYSCSERPIVKSYTGGNVSWKTDSKEKYNEKIDQSDKKSTNSEKTDKRPIMPSSVGK